MQTECKLTVTAFMYAIHLNSYILLTFISFDQLTRFLLEIKKEKKKKKKRIMLTID